MSVINSYKYINNMRKFLKDWKRNIMMSRLKFMNTEIDNLTMDEALHEIEKLIKVMIKT